MMSVQSIISRAGHAVDDVWCRLALATAGDPPGLLAFMFHAVRTGEGSVPGLVDPVQSIALTSLEKFVRHFQEAGYRFVSPVEISKGLDSGGRYVFMTFDDGYYNNVQLVPLLNHLKVPATVFVSTHHVREGKAFWWDVVYRERSKQGVSVGAIRAEQQSLKARRFEEIDQYLEQHFGALALVPESDTDRPMTVDELRAFSECPWVHIGNHTCDHAILPLYDDDEVAAQIGGAQVMLRDVTGIAPVAIAYPNGDHDSRVVSAAREAGLEVGVTTVAGRATLPISAERSLTIPRHAFTTGYDHPRTYRGYRAPISLRGAARGLRAARS